VIKKFLSRKGFFLALSSILLAMIIFSACNLGAVKQNQPTQAPTITYFIDPTLLTPADAGATEEPAETATPTIVASPTGCGYWSEFVEDVTIPDKTEIPSGTTFEKTWRIRNIGCLAWPPGTQLYFWGGDQLGGPDTVDVPSTSPLETTDITVEFAAPDEPGEYLGNWQIIAPDGSWVGPHIYVEIVVVQSTATPIPAWVDFIGAWSTDEVDARVTKIETREEGGMFYAHIWTGSTDWGETSSPSSDADDGIVSLTWTGVGPGANDERTETQQLKVLGDGRLQITGQVDYDDTKEDDFNYTLFLDAENGG